MNNKAKRPLFLRIADWLLNLVLIASGVIILWLLLIITTFSSFKVPTGSMEPAILPGDCILVNKWLIGARIFDVWESVEGKEVEIHRLPGIRKIKRNDVVVFNDPYYRRADSISMDIMLELGPLYVPSEGDEITMDRKHYSLYISSGIKLPNVWAQTSEDLHP